MIHVIASLQIKEGRLSEFVEIFKANVANVLAERGCVEYVPTLDVAAGLAPQELNGNVVTIVEKWDSLPDLLAHLVAPHMLAYGDRVKNMVEKKSLKVLSAA